MRHNHSDMAQEPFGDIPLFREIQRILASGEGPVNLEIARQVATAIATEGVADASPDPDDSRAFSAAVRDAEVIAAGYARLDLVEPMEARLVGRGGWVSTTIDGWRWLIDDLARRVGSELAVEGQPEAAPPQALVAQIAPLLLGIQTGTLIGYIAKEALGRFDFAIPRDDDGRLFFVTKNVDSLAAEYQIEPTIMRRRIVLRDVSRNLVATSVSWLPRYWRNLLSEVIEAIELDTSDLERRLAELQSQGMEALQEGLTTEQYLPVMRTERHTRALERLQAFVALFEGYADHVAGAVAAQLIGEGARVEEAMARHLASPSEAATMLESLLGLAVERDLSAAGVTFCAAVVSLRGMAALNQAWAAADNLPSVAEIRDPFLWIERALA